MRKFLFVFGVLLASAGLAFGANPYNIPAVSSITQLRGLPPQQYTAVYLTQYNATTGQGAGEFVYNGSSSCNDNNGTLIQANGGCYSRITNGQPYNIAWFGAQCGGVRVLDGVSTGSSHTVISASNKWTAAMVGWVAVVNGAASSNLQLVTTVSGYNSAGSITLTAAAGASGTGETITLYPDDTAPIDNAISASNTDGTAITFPNGQSCGFANPGSYVQLIILGRGLIMNNATLYLGQTGTAEDTGVSLTFENVLGHQTVVGPGIIDGGYQTNQGFPQTNATALIFDNNPSSLTDDGIFNLRIQNTKGSAFEAVKVGNFSVQNVDAENCGDYVYQHSSTPGDEVGKSFCGDIENPQGSLNINGYTAFNAAQSGIIISNFTGTASNQASVNLSNCAFSGSQYYNIDIEQVVGPITLSNCSQIGNGNTASGALLYAGAIIRDAGYLTVNNFISTLLDSNSFVVETDNNSTVNWDLSNISLTGTPSRHGASIYVGMTWGGVPQTVSLDNISYDFLQIATSGVACSTTAPRQSLVSFHNLNASGLDSVAGYSTDFVPQGNANSMTYFLGADSDLGIVQIDSAGTNVKASYYDFFRVQMNGSPTFTGNTASATYGGTTWTNPLDSFTCP